MLSFNGTSFLAVHWVCYGELLVRTWALWWMVLQLPFSHSPLICVKMLLNIVCGLWTKNLFTFQEDSIFGATARWHGPEGVHTHFMIHQDLLSLHWRLRSPSAQEIRKLLIILLWYSGTLLLDGNITSYVGHVLWIGRAAMWLLVALSGISDLRLLYFDFVRLSNLGYDFFLKDLWD